MFFKIKNINKEVANDTFVIEMFEEAKVELFRTMRYQVFSKLCDIRYIPNYATSGIFQTMRFQVYSKLCDIRYFPNSAISGIFQTMRYQVFSKICDTMVFSELCDIRYFPNYAISGYIPNYAIPVTFQTMRYQGIFRSIHYSMLDNGNFQAMLFPNYEYKV